MDMWFRLSRATIFRDALRPFFVAGTVVSLIALAPAQTENSFSKNMGGGLRELVQMHHAAAARGRSAPDLRALKPQAAAARPGSTGVFRINVDSRNRVLVNLYLDGTASVDSINAHLKTLGASVQATETNYRAGVIAAHISIAAAEQLANTPGIRSMMLVHRPFVDAGASSFRRCWKSHFSGLTVASLECRQRYRRHHWERRNGRSNFGQLQYQRKPD